MGIFLRQSHNIKPPLWGSPADVQYAIRVNSEKIYGCNPDNDVLVMPLFWGLPIWDYSGYNNYGTNHGATYKDGSLDFDGVSDYVNVPHSSELALTPEGDGTFSFWMYNRGDTAEYQCPLIKTGTYPYQIYFSDNAQQIHFYSNTGGDRSSGVAISTNQWTYITVILEGVGGSFYIDGSWIADNSLMKIGTDNGGAVNIGGFVTSKTVNGIIDEVRISNVARTADQIALFHDNKYGLYQKVGRPTWSIPAVGAIAPTSTIYGSLVGPMGGPI